MRPLLLLVLPLLLSILPLAPQLEAQARVQPRLGIALADSGDDTVQVQAVARESGAAEAGIAAGDRILAVEGSPVRAASEVTAALRGRAVGDTVRIRIRRGTEADREVGVELRALPVVPGWGTTLPSRVEVRRGADIVLPEGRRPVEVAGVLSAALAGRGPLGLELATLNEGLGAYFGRSEGALVLETTSRTPEGIRPGDVLVGVDGRAVRSAEDARRILASYRPDEAATLTLWREGGEVRVEVSVR